MIKSATNEAAPLLRGRARIAHAAGRSERTISRWIKKGILLPLKDGPFKNSVLQLGGDDLERLARGGQSDPD